MNHWKWMAVAVAASLGMTLESAQRPALADDFNSPDLILIEIAKKMEKLEQEVRVLRFMSDIELEVTGHLCKVVGTQSKKVHLGVAPTEKEARQKAHHACLVNEPGASSRFGGMLCPAQAMKCIGGLSDLEGSPIGIR
jgi:hypothetical protein